MDNPSVRATIRALEHPVEGVDRPMDTSREQRLERLRDSVEDLFGIQDSSLEPGALIETAFLMACADGDLSGIEHEQLVATIQYVTGQRFEEGQIRSMLNQLIEALQTDGWERRIAAVAQSLPTPIARRNAYRLAAGMAFIDGEVQEPEQRLFGLLAEAFQIPTDEASQILTEVRDELFGFSNEPDTDPGV